MVGNASDKMQKTKYPLTTLLMKNVDKFKLTGNNKMAIGIIRKVHWEENKYCPHCGCINDIKTHSKSKNGIYRYFCENCLSTFTDLTGTIFARSKISLWKWIYGLIILFESTGCLSAAELSRNIKVSYPTAWKMLKKLRSYLKDEQFKGKLRGVIESDEAWISHKENQQIIMGMVERDGKVKIFPIIDRSIDSLCNPHKLHVQKDSMIMTDSHASYGGLPYEQFIHHWINHSIGEFKRNHIWTNTIESVWAQLKGVIRTIHHGVKKKYIFDYCSLFAFKYNIRNLSVNQKLMSLLHLICQPRCCLY